MKLFSLVFNIIDKKVFENLREEVRADLERTELINKSLQLNEVVEQKRMIIDNLITKHSDIFESVLKLYYKKYVTSEIIRLIYTKYKSVSKKRKNEFSLLSTFSSVVLNGKRYGIVFQQGSYSTQRLV